jgi:Uma2 family endonuclease
MGTLPDAAYFTLAPDWACEVVSPGSGRLDRVRKVPIYARGRVAHLWLVDPLARTLEVYRLDGGRWVVETPDVGDAPARVEPFAAGEIDLRRWWAD